MKFLHCADLHLGRQLHGYPLLEDQRYILEQILNLAQSHQVDALLVAGDIFDRAAPSSEAVALLDWFLTTAAQQHISCFITAGNHDSPERIAYGNRLMEQQGIYLAPVLSGGLSPITLEDAYGPVEIYLLPFLKPAHVRGLWPEEEIANYTAAVQQVLSQSVLENDHRKLLVAHQFVTCATQQPETSDSETLHLGTLDNVDARIFEDFDYVALGHIHKPQNMGSPRVRYAGSPLKYSLSEAGHEKGVTLVELREKGGMEVTFIPLTPLRDLRQVRGTLDELLQPPQDFPFQDYLHILLTEEGTVDALQRLATVYPHIVRLEISVPREGETVTTATSPALAQKNMASLFQDFFQEQTGEALDAESLALVETLLQEEEDPCAPSL